MAGSIPFLNTQYPVTNHNGIEYKKNVYMYKPSHLAVQQRLAHIVSELYFNFLKSEKKKVPVKLIFLQFAICFLAIIKQTPKSYPREKIKPTNCFQYNQHV